ncbi:hypothetical protein SUGI_0971250 [Cryptomeria japonica]|nr:hypothetical protein SUGI_0971250 [Cryptomeria japonica]
MVSIIVLNAGVIVFTGAVDVTPTMKASLKLREAQKSLVRAKIRINILGLSLISGIAVGGSKILCLHMGTFWDAGPAVKVAYKGNDTWNPFSMVLKMGIGEWGSPSAAALAMTIQINLLVRHLCEGRSTTVKLGPVKGLWLRSKVPYSGYRRKMKDVRSLRCRCTQIHYSNTMQSTDRECTGECS